MGKFIGRKIQAGIAKESVRGTAVAPTFWLDLADVTIEDKQENVIDESSIGVIEDAKDLKIVSKYSEGELSGKVGDKSIGLLMLAALGTVSSANHAGETTVKDHTYSVNQTAQHQSITVEAKNPNEQLAFSNAVVSSLEIKAEVGKYVEFVAGIMAKLGTAAANVPSYTAENNFIAKDMTVKFADTAAGLDAASAVSVKNISVKIEKNIEKDDVLGNVAPDDFLNKQFSITGSIELNYDATTYKALALAGTQKALRIDVKDTGVTLGIGTNPEVKIDLPKVKLTEWAKTSAADDVVKQTLTFKAFYSLTDAKMVTVVVTNTQVSY